MIRAMRISAIPTNQITNSMLTSEWQDSNLRPLGPKPSALPLSHIPLTVLSREALEIHKIHTG